MEKIRVLLSKAWTSDFFTHWKSKYWKKTTTATTCMIYSLAKQQWLHWSILSLNPEAPIWKWQIISPLFPETENSCPTRACFLAFPNAFGAEKQLDYQLFLYWKSSEYSQSFCKSLQGACSGQGTAWLLWGPERCCFHPPEPSQILGIIFKPVVAVFLLCLPSPRFWAAKCYTEPSLRSGLGRCYNFDGPFSSSQDSVGLPGTVVQTKLSLHCREPECARAELIGGGRVMH